MSERGITTAYHTHTASISTRALDDFECSAVSGSSIVLVRIWSKESTRAQDFTATPGDALLLAEGLIRGARAALKNLA